MSDIVIVSATRTAIGSFGGSLSTLTGVELGQIVISEALKRAGGNAGDVSEVVMGQVLTAGAGQNPARQASIKAGVPKEVAAMTINQVCGSGLKAVALGAQGTYIGRAFLYGLGAMGEEGVDKVLQILHKELDLTMAFCGRTKITDVDRSILLPGTFPTA